MARPVWRTLRTDLGFARQHLVLNRIAGSSLVPRPARSRLYRALGLGVGRANVYPHVHFLPAGLGRVTVGDDCMINEGVVFDRSADITIGPRVSIGPGAMLCTSSHALGGSSRRAEAVTRAPIVVDEGSWIGARALVLPGVHIGAGVVVAAGAVVTADCQADGLYAGVPARRVKDL